MKARVHVSLKNGVLDPQGKAIGNALHSLGFADVGEVRQGKLIELELTGALAAKPKAEIEATVKDMAQKLLANLVIENFSVELVG
jgi:phosphoribosylformylglycinamidine synthase PurS subunit